MRLGLVAVCLTLPLAVPAAAQAPSPEEVVMSTLDAGQAIERGAPVASALAAVGYSEARARSEGYRIAAPKPRSAGGTTQSMTRMTATGMTGLSLIIHDAADPARSAGSTVTEGWTR